MGAPRAGSVGEAVREARTRHGLSASELAERIRSLADGDAEIETVDRTSLSRIESGATVRPRDGTLRAIAVALGEPPSYFISRTQRDWALSIGIAHGIFSAPAIIAALNSTIEGARFSTFGQGGTDGSFLPKWNSFSSNDGRDIYRPKPSASVPFVADESGASGFKEWVPGSDAGEGAPIGAAPDGRLRTATAAKIIELWARDEIDAAILSKDVFDRQRSLLDEAVHCCTLTHNSGRGISLIALHSPEIDIDVGEGFPKEIIEKVAQGVFGDGKIIVPANTFATEQVAELSRRSPSRINPFEVRVGDYGQFRDRVFEEQRDPANKGVVIVALWEPFVAFLRADWLERLRQEDPSIAVGEKGELPGWRDCSLSRAIDHMGSVGLPAVTMDLLVRKKYLDEAGGVPLELDRFLALLQDATVQINRKSREYIGFNSLAISLTGKDMTAEKYKDLVSPEVKSLAVYYGISELDCIRAVADIGFEIGYAPEYVDYLKKLLARRPQRVASARVSD